MNTQPSVFALLFCALLFVTHGVAWAGEKAPKVEPPAEATESEPAATQTDSTDSLVLKNAEVILWKIQTSLDPKVEEEFRRGIKEALAGESGRHLLTKRGLEKYVAERVGPLPACFRGLEPCVSPSAMAFDALGLSLLIRVKLDRQDKKVVAKYELVDTRGQVVRNSLKDGATARETAFAVIRDIFDATGTLQISSVPEGAAIEVNGVVVGVTPYLSRIPVGAHKVVLRLADHKPVTQTVEIRSGRAENIRHEFLQMSGVLIVENAPPDASVFVNGEFKGRAGERIPLAPGNYTIEVRADGYESLNDAATIEAGGEVKRSAPMRTASSFLEEFGAEAIAVNNYMFRVGYEHVFQETAYPAARSSDDAPFEFYSFPGEDGSAPTLGAFTDTVHANGLRFDISYVFPSFGIVLLSMSYHTASPDRDVFVQTPEGDIESAKFTGLDRLQVRPFQLFYRQIYENWTPFAEAGMGADFQWLTVESDTLGEVGLSQSDPFFAIGFGTHYHFTPNYFASARYTLQAYFDSAIGSDHELYIGIGAAFSNILGIDVEPPEKL